MRRAGALGTASGAQPLGWGRVAMGLLTVIAVWGGFPGQGSAQQVPDSTRAQVFERLRALARPAGLDSTLLVPDSVLEARRAAPAAQATGPDSIVTTLLGLPGYSVTRYEGAGARFDAGTRNLTLRGAEGARARVSQDGFEMVADSAIYYDEDRGTVRSEGAAEFSQPGGEPVTADVLLYDLNQDRGTALGARTTYAEGVNWRVRGDLTSVTPETSWGLHATMTSCELEEPHYHFRTGEVKFVNDNWFVARNVTLRFADVPVMWLPFIAQGLGSGRSSGLLAPRFSVNDIVRTSRGYSRRVSNLGFYWAMSDYNDVTMALDWFSDRFLSLSGSTRFVWARQFLRGNLTYREYWGAQGGSERSFNGNTDWEIDERTRLAFRASYASSPGFVRQNSYDPRELTQTIDSDGGINRRFDWGSINVGANRQQHLSDDKVVTTLPTASLSLSPITFLRASGSDVSWYNNATWSGGGQYRRTTTDLSQLGIDNLTLGTVDQGTTSTSVRSSFTMGALSFSQSLAMNSNSRFDVPLTALPYDTLGPVPMGIRDVTQSDANWSATLDYQQNLIGSLTFTPNLTLSGNFLRSDTIPEALDWVAGPAKMSFGASAKADFYGFFPGFASFSQIRHKIATQVSYDWSPEVDPTDLQQRVFRGSRVVQANNRMSVSINNTFEAKVRPQEDTAQADSLAAAAADSAVAAANAGGPLQPAGQQDGPARRQQEQVVTLLGLNTSAVQYDFVADSTGRWQDGLETTRLRFDVTSDYLRGLTLSSDFELFDNVALDVPDGAPAQTERRFAWHLSNLNLGFSMGANSTVFRWLSRLMGGGAGPVPTTPEPDIPVDDDPLQGASDFDETSIVPRANDSFDAVQRPRPGGGRGWSANFRYSLNRPRGEGIEGTQQLSTNLRFQPTELWSVTWQTAYDINQGRFMDHIVRLSRDLHRWEANFDFRQTLTGTWTFRFEVALKDNRDLKFDYEQRSQELQGFPR